MLSRQRGGGCGVGGLSGWPGLDIYSLRAGTGIGADSWVAVLATRADCRSPNSARGCGLQRPSVGSGRVSQPSDPKGQHEKPTTDETARTPPRSREVSVQICCIVDGPGEITGSRHYDSSTTSSWLFPSRIACEPRGCTDITGGGLGPLLDPKTTSAGWEEQR